MTPLPVVRFARLRRRAVHGPLYDPVVQGLFLVMGAALFASGAWALRSNGLLAAGSFFIAGAIVCCVGFLLLTGRAIERHKLVEYWRDRRALRLELRASRAQTRLLARVLTRLHENEFGDAALDPDQALRELVDDIQGMLAAGHEDAAVLLVLERARRLTVLHTSMPPGSGFRALGPGTTCSARSQPFAEVLRRHAPHDRSYSTSADSDTLRIVVLSDTSFTEEDDALLEPVASSLRLLALCWEPARDVPAKAHLREVG